MSPYFIRYNSMGITWFVFFTVVSIIVSYIIVKRQGKKLEIKKSTIEDTFFIIVIVGLIGARLFYVLLNVNMYRDNIKYIFNLSHFNLSLVGGVLFALLTLGIISKKESVSFNSLVKVFSLPFYLSMSAGVWTMFFDGLLVGKKYNGLLSFKYLGANRHLVVLYLTIVFLLGLVLDKKELIKFKSKYNPILTLIITLFTYYLIKSFFRV